MNNLKLWKMVSVCTIILAACTALVACNNTSTDGSKEETANEKQEASKGGREFYEFTLMQNFTGDMPEESRAYFKKIEDKFNVKINFQIPASSNYSESLQIMLASGEYPDAVLFPNENDPAYLDAIKNDLLVSLTPYMDKYGDSIKKYSYPISLEALKGNTGDELFGIPRTTVNRADGICVRKDWADNLGIELPEEGESISRDKFTELLEAFTKDDPDGNGVDDTYGLSLNSTDGTLTVPQQIAWSFGLVGWKDFDGEYTDLQFSRDKPNYKDTLKYMNMIWEKGYLDPDWPNIKIDVAQQRLEAGSYGMQACFPGNIDSYTINAQKLNPNAKFVWFSGIENDEGKVEGAAFASALWGFTSIMKTAKNPERILEIYNYMLSDEGWQDVVYGLENVSWKLNDKGEKVVANPDINPQLAWERQMVRRSTDPSFFVGLEVEAGRRQRLIDLIKVSMDNSHFSLNAGFTAPASKELEFIDMQTEYNEIVTKIIVGDLPVDDYDAILEDYYKAGYQKVSDETIEFIKNHKD